MEEGEGQNENSGESDEAPPKVIILLYKLNLYNMYNKIIFSFFITMFTFRKTRTTRQKTVERRKRERKEKPEERTKRAERRRKSERMRVKK